MFIAELVLVVVVELVAVIVVVVVAVVAPLSAPVLSWPSSSRWRAEFPIAIYLPSNPFTGIL